MSHTRWTEDSGTKITDALLEDLTGRLNTEAMQETGRTEPFVEVERKNEWPHQIEVAHLPNGLSHKLYAEGQKSAQAGRFVVTEDTHPRIEAVVLRITTPPRHSLGDFIDGINNALSEGNKIDKSRYVGPSTGAAVSQ